MRKAVAAQSVVAAIALLGLSRAALAEDRVIRVRVRARAINWKPLVHNKAFKCANSR